MPELPFEVIGKLPGPWEPDLASFAESAESHRWGNDALDKLLIGKDFDEMAEHLEVWLPPSDWSSWKAGYENGRQTLTAGKSFRATDDSWCAVIPFLEDKDCFLLLFGHEYIECSLDSQQDEEGYVWPGHTDEGVGHILWTEYVVERARRQVANSLSLPFSSMANGFVAEQLNDFASDLPTLDWSSRLQLWYDLVRVWAMSQARADEGSPDDLVQLVKFRQHSIVQQTDDLWDRFSNCLRDIFDDAMRPTDEFDSLTVAEGWLPLVEACRLL